MNPLKTATVIEFAYNHLTTAPLSFPIAFDVRRLACCTNPSSLGSGGSALGKRMASFCLGRELEGAVGEI